MVQDLQAAGQVLAESDVVAAIAGDPEAQELLAEDDIDEPTVEAPEHDYSVLDADSSQRKAIDAVLAGRSLVIHGPPGTGKSQTIANLIAALVARGRKVLFVAEKRAAIDAVLSRLKGADLGEVVLDIHEGTKDRARIATELGIAMDEAQRTPEPDVGDLHRRLTDRHRRLTRHVSALHQNHQPWGLTPFQVQSALLGVSRSARIGVRLDYPEQIGKERADQIRDELREFAHLGGFTLRPESTPWFGAALRGPEEARQACELADRLSSRGLPMLVDRAAHAAAEVGLRPPATYPDAVAMMQLLTSIQASLRMLSADVYAADPGRLAVATGAGTGLSFRDRRALRKQGRSLVVDAGEGGAGGRPRSAGELTDAELSAAFSQAADELARWQQLRTDDGMPRLPARLDELLALAADCEAQLDVMRAILSMPADPQPLLTALAADQDTAWKLPRLYELAARFGELCLGPLLDELARRGAGPDLAADAFDYAWYSAILDQMRVLDPRYAADQGGALDEIAGDFRAHDVHHLTANRARVRRAWAQALLDASDRHPLQARVIRKQAALRRGHVPLRRLLDQASDVLFAIKPCWAMSPLMVSQVLPVATLFDVVIFDEASQIVPADAIPAIMRGHQIVVAGDDRQLPPTNFFHQVGDPDEESADDEDLVSFGAGFESVLDALRPLLPTAALAWHYRSRDERLVAFSNSRVYGGALTTFPGVFTGDCLRHVVVAQGPGRGQETSVDAEVSKVVELILEHAREHPRESLGVIALGIKHAERIDAALRTALAGLGDLPDGGQSGLEAFFAEDVPSPSSSRTWSEYKATSETRSSCRSATASIPMAGCGTSGGRCYVTAASAGSTLRRRVPSTGLRSSARSPVTTSILTGSPRQAPECWPSTWTTRAPAARRRKPPARCSSTPSRQTCATGWPRPASGSWRSTASAATGSTSPRRTRRIRAGWCSPSRQTALPTGSRAASGTVTGCVASTCSGLAGTITASGPPTGSGIRTTRWPRYGRRTCGPFRLSSQIRKSHPVPGLTPPGLTPPGLTPPGLTRSARHGPAERRRLWPVGARRFGRRRSWPAAVPTRRRPVAPAESVGQNGLQWSRSVAGSYLLASRCCLRGLPWKAVRV